MTEDGAISAERPWGSWQILDEGPGYKVKRIHVRPGHRLSYQTHALRAEHWLVIKGRPTCVVNDEERTAAVGECLNVGVGIPHRLANREDDELIIVEIQRGDYTAEDDIVRLDDDYDRCEAP